MIHNLRVNGIQSIMTSELYELMPETDMQLAFLPKLRFKFRKGLLFNVRFEKKKFIQKQRTRKNFENVLNSLRIWVARFLTYIHTVPTTGQ